MPASIPNYVSSITTKSLQELVTAYLNIPEDKRHWSPDGKARTAADQIAECTVTNGYTALLLEFHKWETQWMDEFFVEKARVVSLSWEDIHDMLEENTAKLISALNGLQEKDLEIEINMPWGKQKLSELIVYPYWNMSYHLGQINYIASMLGCLP